MKALTAALLVLATPAAGGVKTFRAALDKTEAHLGDVIKCLIEVEHAPGEQYDLPDPLELKPFRVRKVDTKRGDEHTTFMLELQVFDVGEPEVPAITLSGPEKVEVPPQKIKVLSLVDEEAAAQAQSQPPGAAPQEPAPPEFKDVKPPVPFRVESYLLLWILGGVLAAAALALLAAWLWRRRGERAAAAAPPRPPHEVALEKLAQLARDAPWTRGRKKEHYLAMSEIVRTYLEARFGVLALEETTEELLERLAQASTPGLDYDAFAAWSREGDLVKFARFEPTDGQCKAALERAIAFVEATRPREAAPESGRRAA